MERFTSDKIEGRLRVIGRSSPDVNAARAECKGAVKIAEKRSGKPVVTLPQMRLTFDTGQSIKQEPKEVAGLKKGSNDAASSEIEVQGFAVLRNSDEPFSHKISARRRGRICDFSGTLEEVNGFANDPQVVAVHMADTLRRPVTADLVSGSPPRRMSNTAPATHEDRHKHGENILIGLIDVGGYDFAHPDFLNEDGSTRFVRIWDQGGSFHNSPGDFGYGAEIHDVDMNAAISEAPGVGLPPQTIEPQSEMSPGSHGTHVASIAAGNSGLCSKAKIAGVLLSLPASDADRRLSFYDTTRIAHAVDYLLDLGEKLGVEAVAVNISLGTNGGPHDNSSPMIRWIDEALTKPGRSVCVAAGNAGQEAPLHAQDIGFTMGRIHTSGRIPAAGLERRIDWVVVGDQIEDLSENELEIWYEAQDRISVQVKPPNGTWTEPVEPGTFIRNRMLPDKTFLSVFNELYDAGNGCNKISIYLSPYLDNTVVGITPGVWTVRLIGDQIRDGRYHGWIERDDPRELGRFQDRAFWQFPSFFSNTSNVDDSSISTLACGDRIIAVANYDEAREIVNISSSQGPTRDNRQKPDVCAPGTSIIAANGFDPDVPWVAKTGTSMASPYLTGAVGLMQAVAPAPLTSAQILGIIKRTARPLPSHEFKWRNDTGFGGLNLAAALEEAAVTGHARELTEGGGS